MLVATHLEPYEGSSFREEANDCRCPPQQLSASAGKKLDQIGRFSFLSRSKPNKTGKEKIFKKAFQVEMFLFVFWQDYNNISGCAQFDWTIKSFAAKNRLEIVNLRM